MFFVFLFFVLLLLNAAEKYDSSGMFVGGANQVVENHIEQATQLLLYVFFMQISNYNNVAFFLFLLYIKVLFYITR